MKTTPFQKPLKLPVVPTARSSGYDENFGLMNVVTRFVVGATQTASRMTKNMSGIRIYCLNESGERVGTVCVFELGGGRAYSEAMILSSSSPEDEGGGGCMLELDVDDFAIEKNGVVFRSWSASR